ncbi:helix-turn-helix transcriptional regulator [Nitrospirillum bahiense]|uniref:LuxR family transcriptional regulator n=1 Tax=Nitrospirillum amazonense TaxID=28077 RepID=A0A560FHL6_9PROT|nr:hypothetical protein [Nitrospirillum amazonense]TWB21112.1 LuxR family transcriptional regulator [Nitrospirillum amazonense]
MTDDIERLLDLIYDAPWQPDGWAVVLREVRSAVGAVGGHILDSDFSGAAPVRRYLVQQGVPKEAQEDYDANWYADDPRWAYGVPNVGHVIADHEQLPPEMRRTHGFYRSYLPAYDFGPLLSVPFETGPRRVVGFQLLRPNKAEVYGPEEKRLLTFLLPHLRRAMAATARLGAVLSQQDAAHAALERIDSAVILAAPDGKVIFANSRASRIAALGDGLHLRAGRLVLDDRAAQRQLDRHITGAAPQLLLRAKRPSGLPDFVLHATLTRPGESIGGPLFLEPRICIFISDPVLMPLAAEETLRQAFRLTPAEARLAQGLLNGLNRADYARAQGVSINTVKRQLDNVFAKTQTASQQELIAVMTRCLAAMAAPAF